MNDGRPDWDSYGLDMAAVAAGRADCTRRKVGAMLMAPDRSVVVTGYNGGPSGGPSCLKGECPRGGLSYDDLPPDSPYDTGGGTCVALHAEWNVMLRASWQDMVGSTLYITEEPCHICKTMISGTHIIRVVYPDGEWIPDNKLAQERAKSMANHPAGKKRKPKFCKGYENDQGFWMLCFKPFGHEGSCEGSELLGSKVHKPNK